MQASAPWTPPRGTLGVLVAEAAERVRTLSAREAELEAHAAATEIGPPFTDALRRGAHVAVIAELKRQSPSRGKINVSLGAAEQALAYERGGAAALSVLTEPSHFGGSADDLLASRSASPLPILKKDFHVDRLQLVEARLLGASAVLLIARALAPAAMTGLAAAAAALGLEVLFEVRDREELARALDCGATLVGVNNRDLETLEIDPTVGDRLIPLVPAGVVAVAESGIRTADDVRRAAAAGADAVLVGSSVSAAPDPVVAVRALAHVRRSPRGG